MKKSFIVLCLMILVVVSPVSAWWWEKTPEQYQSAEEGLKQAATLDGWRQQLQQRETALMQRESSLTQHMQQQQQQHEGQIGEFQQREAALAQQLQQQQTAVQQQQHAQEELQQQLQREAWLRRLAQQQARFSLQEQVQKTPQTPSETHSAYGYADNVRPGSTTLPDTQGAALPTVAGTQAGSPPHTTIMVVQQPTPLPTLQPQDSRIHTIINGIDQVETTAVLPQHLDVDQLGAVKKIADNGALIAQQRFAVEQYRIDSTSKLEWFRISKGFVLWGLLLSIPFLVTLSWIARNALRGWRDWQRDRLTYKLQELESLERQIVMSEKHFDSRKS